MATDKSDKLDKLDKLDKSRKKLGLAGFAKEAEDATLLSLFPCEKENEPAGEVGAAVQREPTLRSESQSEGREQSEAPLGQQSRHSEPPRTPKMKQEILIPEETMTDTQMIDYLSSYPVEKMPSVKAPMFSDYAIRQVYEQTASINGISLRSAIIGIHQLLRKGAANSGSPSALQVEVYCPDTKRTVAFTKGELEIVATKKNESNKDDRNICRTFAESIAVVACTTAQNQIASNKVSIELLAGDLYGKINRGLVSNKQPRLTPREAVWCCSYCQNIPNLNELAGSERLEQLLTRDLEERLEANKKKAIGQQEKGIKRGQSPQKAKNSLTSSQEVKGKFIGKGYSDTGQAKKSKK